MAKILLVDDELTMVQMVVEVLRAEGHEVFPFTHFNGVMEALDSRQPDLVITDLYLDKTKPHGFEIIQRARALRPPPTVIMITGFGTVDSAVEAMRLGAFDYLQKPFKLEDLKFRVNRALTTAAVVAENTYLRKEVERRYGFDQMIGASARMQEVFHLMERVADTDATVLILGESGTGKELVARALHYNSRRRTGPFIPINCSALPENLLESELFGHRRGAFTGAVNDKNGLFHDADGGTIFLDEIGTMPAQLQSRLLRVLQEKEVRRVGDNVPVTVNVRVLAATNERLEELVKSGKFREDLYYRLNVVAVGLPPLRDRKEDIPMLVAHFLRGKLHGRSQQPFRVSQRALDALTAHNWPGNVREFENAIERACLLSDGAILRARDLPPVVAARASGSEAGEDSQFATVAEPVVHKPAPPPSPAPAASAPAPGGTQPAMPATVVSLKKFSRDQELAYIRHVLALTGQDKEQAAARMEISLATLYRKLADDGE
jgi:two-component system, NtrC family, response regulator AtoC